MKEIAHEYGYSHPSGTLFQRIKNLGFTKLNKLNDMASAHSLSLTTSQVEKVKQRKGLEGQLFFNRKVTESGDVLLKFHDSEYIEEDKE